MNSTQTQETVPFLDLVAQNVALKEELLGVMSNALDTAGFIGGPQLVGFESEFASYTQSKYAIGVNSGTDALRFALMAMGIEPGSNVITVPNTFIATTEAISQAGCKIEFVDVDPATSLLDANRLEDLLKERFSSGPRENRPKAVVPVHLYGQCADMDAISELAKKYEFKILEDAAQAQGASYKGRPAGTLADAAGFSFYPGKNLGACGEAGAVTTHDELLADKIKMIRDHGQKTKYYHDIEGYNGRLDAIQAGFLRVKLRHLNQWNENRRKHCQMYDQAFSKIDWIRPVHVMDYNIPSRHLYVIHVPNRDSLRNYLQNKGVSTGLHYPLPLHLQKCYEHLGYKKGDFIQSEKAADELVSLPLYAELTEQQVEKVIKAVLEFKGI